MPTKLPSPGRREDPHLGIRVHIVGTRQRRPNLPTTGCPFCPGGIEAPDPYEVRWFTNRWLAMEGDRCEVVLYTPDHDASFESLGSVGARRVVDLMSLSDHERQALADLLVDVFGRLDRLFDQPLPYMMWLNQRPTVPTGWDDAWFNIEIVSPWRAAGVQRFIAAAEVATGEFFNPVVPEELAERLRSV